MATKFVVYSLLFGHWTKLSTKYHLLSEITGEFPRLRIAKGPDQAIYGMNGTIMLKIEQYEGRYRVFYRDAIGSLARDDKKDAFHLGDAKSNIRGNTIWFEPNEFGVSYGLGEDGVSWVIEEHWAKI